MEVLDIDWKNIDSRLVKDEFYEGIRAPKWLDFLAPEEPVDDDAWFCKPDCNHAKNAASFVKSPVFRSNKMRQPRLMNSSSSVSTSSTSPLGNKTASALNSKKNMGPLSTSITSLYELKAKENASGNVKKSSPLDRNKLQSTTFKYREHSENENPNRQRSASAVATSGRTPKLQSKKNTSTVVKASKQNSPVNLEKKGVGREAIHNLNTSSTGSPVAPSVSSGERGDRKQTFHSTSAYSPSTTHFQFPNPPTSTVPTEDPKIHPPTSTIPTDDPKIHPPTCTIPTDDPKIPSTKPGFAVKHTFSARNLFGKTAGKEFLAQISEFCSELKNLALNGSQADSSKQSNKHSKLSSNSSIEDQVKIAQDIDGNCLSVLSSERSIQDGSDNSKVNITSNVVDPDKCSKSGPMETGWLRHRSIKATAKICPKSLHQRQSMNDSNKKENTSSISDQKDHHQVHMEEIGRDTLGIADDPCAKKVRNRGDSPSADSFSGPIPCQEHGTSANLVNPETQRYMEGLDSHKNVLKEAHRKSIHAKIFNPSIWKKRRNEGMMQKGDCAKADCPRKDTLKQDFYQKIQSCPPSPQKVSRFSPTSTSSGQGRKPKMTPVQPLRTRTTEQCLLKELQFNKKSNRSFESTDNILTSPESKLYLPDVFWFLKGCTSTN